MFDSIKGMADVMKLMGQAGKIKENMAQAQERARNRTAVGESGAGMVKVTANGIGEIVAVDIDPEVLKDAETVGPLLVSAINTALFKSKEVLMEETKTAMGGIDLPPGMLG
ncbi:MAG TPA: YbaB/EbfC family nucleoid-associated protein [Planctomycetota bacterium]|nr:YbaB/EbfC family nucleoid-associated protein [Planctomycetota bacterium]